MIVTSIPEGLRARGIEQPQASRGFAIALDVADPWGGGRIEGRVERRAGHDPQPVVAAVRLLASWLDVAPQLVGRKRLLGLSTFWDVRNRGVPIWLDEEIWSERWELGSLGGADNWLHFSFELPRGLPRAFEGTFVAFRWRIEARRARRLGHETASLPLLLVEERPQPVVRVETTPLGEWRLLEWRNELEGDGAGGGCAVRFEERRPQDAPLPGESRTAELRRRGLRA